MLCLLCTGLFSTAHASSVGEHQNGLSEAPRASPPAALIHVAPRYASYSRDDNNIVVGFSRSSIRTPYPYLPHVTIQDQGYVCMNDFPLSTTTTTTRTTVCLPFIVTCGFDLGPSAAGTIVLAQR